MLVAGHVGGLVLGHDRALALYGKARAAKMSHYWMLAMMVALPPSGFSFSPGQPMTELLRAELLSSLVLGGHTGYGRELRESRGEDGGGEIGLPWIVAVLLLAGGTVALLVWLSPSSTKGKLKKVAPGLLIAAVMATPLIVWTATSGDDEQGLIVERGTSANGAPEFIVSLAGDNLNTLDTTNGKRAVRVKCLGREGQVVLEAKQRWPFDNERGYEYPHAHQAASSEQLRRADRCHLQGTHVRLEADVEGSERRRPARAGGRASPRRGAIPAADRGSRRWPGGFSSRAPEKAGCLLVLRLAEAPGLIDRYSEWASWE